jgi:hypothetical protein
MKDQHIPSPVEVFSGTIIEAGLIKSFLEGNEIRAYLKDELMGTWQPWFVSPGGKGSVKVVVADNDAKRATELVDAYYKNSNPDSVEF